MRQADQAVLPKFSQNLLYFILLNLCFLSLQFILVYSEAGNFVSSIPLPWRIYAELLATFSIHLGLYFILSCIQALMLQGVLQRSWHYFSPLQWQLIIWSTCVCALLCANLYYFPLSIYSKILAPLLPAPLLIILLSSTFFILFLLIVNNRLLFISTVILVLVVLFWSYREQGQHTHSQASNPNIIILGIDSLSPDSINPQNMPYLYKRLQKSLQFTNTISPLARTFPAWCTILTGLYAKHHHAEENLVSKRGLKTKESMIWAFNQQGYHSFFASDDRRFNGLDSSFGFQQILGPKLGVNDTLLGSFNDFPLSNLLINLPVGAWLFPYNHMNRASFFSYYPQTFDSNLQKELLKIPEKPLFLAVHFTLAHWPYAWAESSPEDVNNEFSLEKRDLLYHNALKRVDQQFESLFTFLKTHNFLKNSLVLFLSDHGEVLYHENSRLTNYENYQGLAPSPLAEYFKNKTATLLNKSAGHGSDLLSPGQYQSLLAFNRFKEGKLESTPSKIVRRVALIDIAPTILSILNLNYTKKDGISLLGTLSKPKQLPPSRAFYLESGMFPNQELSKEKVLQIGKTLYDINSLTGELEIKAKQLAVINKQKLYAVIEGSWIAAVYPDGPDSIIVIQNLKTKQWTDKVKSNFANSTPLAKLLKKLAVFYGKGSL